MNIALYGTGKMGQAIAQVARQRGHTIALEVHAANAGASPKGMDVAIEFSRPEHAVANIRLCVEAGVPVVVGTTGWYDHLHEVQQVVAEKKGSVLWASNFSIGVNLFFRVNRLLAQLMDTQAQYNVHLDEIHHIHKLDAPSGTAITLARDIDLRTQRYSGWKLKDQEQAQGRTDGHAPAPAPAPVEIQSERTGEVPGKHSVSWTSAADRIIITHEAFGRTGFSTGAVLAAEWLADPVQKRQGLFTMEDVLG
ncbi:MAG: 4-hydroxy-tetrahydrodipicolinate reductase [Flavobacteriales bacterium]|nr:4-hydroxy-tetrahydrodipicolinate reductase [Flavobacteriales bacterium]MBK7086329.1 4-hydroxy-tetrahydrodipicolinate reductase [Flavobacteriales bacterium]MBK7269043.1 4-hydroxy-tetrahydrodipicolinate reductase [Flavobacteriales bacterium]MBK7752402.1 4-hydroxy-tetrahydrodipicolinate reductase [Flavobacteriales bacterium]MBK9075578.1 4-hydroxy-tetrahydrodipicolinate reductase [Flavobacteriales bacterium]